MHALRGVSFTVAPAAMVVIVGKSGSGKTTLLNCLGGLDRPDSGRVIVRRPRSARAAAAELSLFLRRDMGFVFQFGNLLSYLTVFENIAFPLTLNNMGAREKNHRVAGAAGTHRPG